MACECWRWLKKNQTGSNLPKPVGSIIGKAFADAGLVFPQLNKGKYIFKGPTPVDIRHAQVTWKHREMPKRNPSITATQISKKTRFSLIMLAISTLDTCKNRSIRYKTHWRNNLEIRKTLLLFKKKS